VLKGFKDFILRGNVVDLAVAVVVGAAFTSIVTASTKSIIEPLINAVTPPTSPGFGIQLVEGKPSTFIDLAGVITAVVNFLIVAAVVYFVIVLPLNTLKARRKRGEETGPAEPTDVELLAEIRDLLADQGGRGSFGRPIDAHRGTVDGPAHAADRHGAGRPAIGDGRSDERRV
jgi:large conductance mechanosensitive channel